LVDALAKRGGVELGVGRLLFVQIRGEEDESKVLAVLARSSIHA
jgi:hypothetical protein